MPRATRAGRRSSRLALAARRLFDVKRLEITFYYLTNAQTLATVSSSGSGVWRDRQCGEPSNAGRFTHLGSPILPRVPPVPHHVCCGWSGGDCWGNGIGVGGGIRVLMIVVKIVVMVMDCMVMVKTYCSICGCGESWLLT